MAAVIATLDVMERESGPQRIWDMASKFADETPFGHAPFCRFSTNAAVRKALNEKGVLAYASHNFSLAHDDNAMKRLSAAWVHAMTYVGQPETRDNQVMRR